MSSCRLGSEFAVDVGGVVGAVVSMFKETAMNTVQLRPSDVGPNKALSTGPDGLERFLSRICLGLLYLCCEVKRV